MADAPPLTAAKRRPTSDPRDHSASGLHSDAFAAAAAASASPGRCCALRLPVITVNVLQSRHTSSPVTTHPTLPTAESMATSCEACSVCGSTQPIQSFCREALPVAVRALTTMSYSALPVAVVRSSGRSSALHKCTTIFGPHVGRPAVRHLAQDREAQAAVTQHSPEC
jgi:hypothetical protein